MPVFVQEQNLLKKQLLAVTAPIAQSRNVPLYVKSKAASRVEEAIYGELARHRDISMVLLGYPKDESKIHTPNNILKKSSRQPSVRCGGIAGPGLEHGIRRVLVPVGNWPQRAWRRLARTWPVRAYSCHGACLIMKCDDAEVVEDQQARYDDIRAQREKPPYVELKVEMVSSVLEGILEEIKHGNYDLMIIGAAEEVLSPSIWHAE